MLRDGKRRDRRAEPGRLEHATTVAHQSSREAAAECIARPRGIHDFQAAVRRQDHMAVAFGDEATLRTEG